MKLIIDIPEEAYKQIMDFGFLENTHGKICYKAIKNGTPIPDNATNGDMVKAMFPNTEVKTNGLITSVKGLDCDKGALDPYRHFESDWWNAPYQKGGTSEQSAE